MTLIEDAKKGVISDFVKKAAEYEGIEAEKLIRLISHGYVVLPKNVKREEIQPRAIGMLTSTKVNANVGTSADYVNVDEEIEKAIVAQKAGADAVMDLSSGGDLDAIRKRIMEVVKVPFGTVQYTRQREIAAELLTWMRMTSLRLLRSTPGMESTS